MPKKNKVQVRALTTLVVGKNPEDQIPPGELWECEAEEAERLKLLGAAEDPEARIQVVKMPTDPKKLLGPDGQPVAEPANDAGVGLANA